jgi:hypothetical protein
LGWLRSAAKLVPTSKSQPDGTLVTALARAWRWQRVLESGEYGTLAELADAERISRSYVCRILRLTIVAPDIVERILVGRPTAGLAEFLKPFPVGWGMQRQKFCRGNDEAMEVNTAGGGLRESWRGRPGCVLSEPLPVITSRP